MVKKVIFRLTIEGKTPSTWELPQTSVMGIKEGKGKKFIEYYPGEDSCFVEDIQAKNKDLKPERVPLFQYNAQTKQTELAVDASNLSLINYLQTHPWFGLKFGIYSKEKEAQDSLSEFEDVEKALDLIKDSDEIKTKATSMAVFGLNSFYKSFTQCAAELKAKAIKEPKVIIEAISASNYETKFVAGLALVSEIIKINATHTAIVWTENDGVILHIAQGENGLDKLTNFLTNETKEAQILLQEFNTRLERKERMIARSSDADKVISEKDAEIAELKRKLAASKIANENKINFSKKIEEVDEEDSSEEPLKNEEEKSMLEQLQEDYKIKFKTEVPIRYKNDQIWLAKKLAE